MLTSEMAECLRRMSIGEKCPQPPADSDLHKVYVVLHDQQLVKENINGEYEITPAGISALMEYDRQQDEMRQQATAQAAEEERRVREQRKSQAHDWRVGIFGAIIAGVVILIIGFLLGR